MGVLSSGREQLSGLSSRFCSLLLTPLQPSHKGASPLHGTWVCSCLCAVQVLTKKTIFSLTEAILVAAIEVHFTTAMELHVNLDTDWDFVGGQLSIVLRKDRPDEEATLLSF